MLIHDDWELIKLVLIRAKESYDSQFDDPRCNQISQKLAYLLDCTLAKLDSRTRPWKSLTVLDINFNSPELTTYTTYDIQTLKTIQYEQLPRFIAGHILQS